MRAARERLYRVDTQEREVIRMNSESAQRAEGGVRGVRMQVSGNDHRVSSVARLRSRDMAGPTEIRQDFGDLRHDRRRAEHTQMQHQRSLGPAPGHGVT
jgi:hypothetical protein